MDNLIYPAVKIAIDFWDVIETVACVAGMILFFVLLGKSLDL